MTDARILDRGYRKYDGERSGVPGAVKSVAWHTTRSILGLGRAGRHKVFPIIVGIVAFVPALVFMAVAVLFGEIGDEVRPDYWEFFGFSLTAALLFTAFVAPEAVVRDRRDGMFALYLSTPLTKPTYLIAKAIAVVGTLWLIVGAPPLFAFIGYTSQGLGPDGFPAWLGVAGRLLLAGLGISAIYAAVSLAASSLTDRRAFASVAVILLVFGLSIAVGLIVGEAGFDQHLALLDPLGAPYELAARLFGGRTEDLDQVATIWVVVADLAWLLVPIGVIAARYRKMSAV
jgi:ABC-2 type transport system permease protein